MDKKPLKIHEWQLIPTPRMLWIVKTKNPDDISEYFYDDKGEDIKNLSENMSMAKAGVVNVSLKSSGVLGIVVVIQDRLKAGDMAHEAWHVVDNLCEQTGWTIQEDTGNEHIAYMIGFVTNKIWEVCNNKLKD